MCDSELDFDVVSIDTCIFVERDYQFNNGILKEMSQFSDHNVSILQTEVVHRETIKHFTDEIKKAKTSIKRGIRLAKFALDISEDDINKASQLLKVECDDYIIAEQILRKYYKQIGATVLYSSKYVDVSRLLDKYFMTEAPFEEGKEKKHEFPDAIALLSLERWAKENNKKILAISKDKGWANFAGNSDYITVCDDLAKVLEKLQSEIKVKQIVAFIRDKHLLDRDNLFLDKVKEVLIDKFMDSSPYIEANSAYRYEETSCYCSYKDIVFVKDESGAIDISVLEAKDNIVKIQVNADITYELDVDFDFYVPDSIDHDDINIGSSNVKTTETFNTDVLITLSGNLEVAANDIEVKDIDVLSDADSVDLGNIEPDLRE